MSRGELEVLGRVPGRVESYIRADETRGGGSAEAIGKTRRLEAVRLESIWAGPGEYIA